MSPTNANKRKKLRESIKIKVGMPDNIRRTLTPTNLYESSDNGENNSDASDSERKAKTVSPSKNRRDKYN